MTPHPPNVPNYEGTLDDLARAIGNMTYDQTASFIEKLALDLKEQADRDKARGRTQLATELYNTANKLYEAKENMEKAWKICKPYMPT